MSQPLLTHTIRERAQKQKIGNGIGFIPNTVKITLAKCIATLNRKLEDGTGLVISQGQEVPRKGIPIMK
jgi:hypothetical protein